jgi:serine/threonine protein kinase
MVASRTEGGLGTPLWAAPEQGKGGEHIRPSVDVWALGLLTFYVLTDKLFWFHANDDRASMLDIATEMLRDDIPLASERANQLDVGDLIPEHFDAWLARCVNRDAEARFSDAQMAKAALADVFAGRSLPPSPPPTSQPPGSDKAQVLGTEEPAGPRPTRGHDHLPPTRRRGATAKPPIGIVIGVVAVLVAVAALSAWWLL